MSRQPAAVPATLLFLAACGVIAACAPVTPEARAAMMDRAHTPEERAEYNNQVRAYQGLRAE